MTYEAINVEQGTDEWKALRLTKTTASQVPVLYDLSPYQTKLQLFEEKSFGRETDVSSFKERLFARGHEAEKAGREWVESNLGLKVPPAVLVSKSTPDLMASLDGFNAEKRIIFEAKYMGREKLLDVKKGQIPAHHECQIQAQLLVSGAAKCIYFAMDGDDAAMVEVTPNVDMLNDIPAQVAAFMTLVREGKAPEPTGRDYYKPDDSRFTELLALKHAMDESEAAFKAFKDELLAEYAQHPRIKSGGLIVTRSFRKGNVQYAKIPQLKGVDLERYRSASVESVTVSIYKGVKNEK